MKVEKDSKRTSKARWWSFKDNIVNFLKQNEQRGGLELEQGHYQYHVDFEVTKSRSMINKVSEESKDRDVWDGDGFRTFKK